MKTIWEQLSLCGDVTVPCMQQTHCEYSPVEFKDRTWRVRAILVSNQVLHFIYRKQFKYVDQESPFHYPGHQSINRGALYWYKRMQLQKIPMGLYNKAASYRRQISEAWPHLGGIWLTGNTILLYSHLMGIMHTSSPCALSVCDCALSLPWLNFMLSLLLCFLPF